MSAVTLSGSQLAAAISAAGTSASGIGGTVTANAGWFLFLGALSIIVGIFGFLKWRMSRMGR